MTFEEIQHLIQAELDGEIEPEREAELQQALAESAELRKEYERQKELAALLAGDRQSISPPTDLPARVLEGVLARDAAVDEAAAGRQAPIFALSRFVRPLAAAAAIVVLVTGTFFLTSQETTANQDPAVEQLQKSRQTLIQENPEQREEIEELFGPFLERFRSTEKSDHDTRRRIKEELETSIRDFLER